MLRINQPAHPRLRGFVKFPEPEFPGHKRHRLLYQRRHQRANYGMLPRAHTRLTFPIHAAIAALWRYARYPTAASSTANNTKINNFGADADAASVAAGASVPGSGTITARGLPSSVGASKAVSLVIRLVT